MSTVYLLQNHQKLILNRNREWTDARDLKCLYQTPHKDEGINQKVEVNSKDYTQRIHLLECELNDKKLPIIAAEHMPEPLPDQPKADREGAQASLIETDQDHLSQIAPTDLQSDLVATEADDNAPDVAEVEADEQADDAAEEFDQDAVQD